MQETHNQFHKSSFLRRPERVLFSTSLKFLIEENSYIFTLNIVWHKYECSLSHRINSLKWEWLNTCYDRGTGVDTDSMMLNKSKSQLSKSPESSWPSEGQWQLSQQHITHKISIRHHIESDGWNPETMTSSLTSRIFQYINLKNNMRKNSGK